MGEAIVLLWNWKSVREGWERGKLRWELRQIGIYYFAIRYRIKGEFTAISGYRSGESS